MTEHSESYTAARALRFPVWTDDPGAPKKISDLEDHLMLGAYYDGELVEERAAARETLDGLAREWAHLVGWEPFREGKTVEAVVMAKRQLRPELWDEMEAAKALIRRLSEQIDRIERDYVKVSRLYTMLTGS